MFTHTTTYVPDLFWATSISNNLILRKPSFSKMKISTLRGMPFWGSKLYYHSLSVKVCDSFALNLQCFIMIYIYSSEVNFAHWLKYPYHWQITLSSFSSSAKTLQYLTYLVNVWIVENVSPAVLILHPGKEHLILKPSVAGYDPWLQG